MSALPYLIPWIILLLAVALAAAVKLLPLKSIAGIAVNSAILLVLIALAIYANVIASQQDSKLAVQESTIGEMEQWKYRHLDELTLVLAQLKPPTEKEQALLQDLISFGWNAENAVIRQAQNAHRARSRLMHSFKPGSPMLIKGIPTSVNTNIVSLGLKEAGFIVLPYQEDEKPESDVNIIYYGRDMQLPEIQLAALTLMQAGIDLKAIKPFPKATQGNLRAIRIEWNKYYDGRKSMSVEDVENATAFN